MYLNKHPTLKRLPQAPGLAQYVLKSSVLTTMLFTLVPEGIGDCFPPKHFKVREMGVFQIDGSWERHKHGSIKSAGTERVCLGAMQFGLYVQL